ncbi:MAG: hypothetical protein AAF495_05480, partial [Pseudomonadota bacterium]
GYITMNEIYQYAHDQVIAESHQEPMKWDLNVRGELYVAKSGKTPREDRRKAVRDHLLKLAGDGLIPDDILSSALEIAALPATGLDDRQKKLDQLLDDILEGRVGTGNFIGAWYKTQAEPAPKARTPPPPPGPDPAESAEPEPEKAPPKPSAGHDDPPEADWNFRSSALSFGMIMGAHIIFTVASVALGNLLLYNIGMLGFLIIYVAPVGYVLVILWRLRRFFAQAAQLSEPSYGRFVQRFPNGTSPKAVLIASTLGLAIFILFTALSLVRIFGLPF